MRLQWLAKGYFFLVAIFLRGDFFLAGDLRVCKRCFACSSSCFRSASRFLPARLINIWIMRIAEPRPPGLTFFDAMVRATVLASLVNVFGGGWVESVLILADHFGLVDFL